MAMNANAPIPTPEMASPQTYATIARAIEHLSRPGPAASDIAALAHALSLSERALVEPTVIAGIEPDSPVIADETFGPVIAIRTFRDAGRAIEEVNAGAYGLQAGVFTNDHAIVKQFSRKLDVGGVMINEGPDFRAEHVPFGGIKMSGLGREGVRIAIREMSETRVVID